ncbi:MAG TPA: diphthine synthase [Thermoplasmata archaeon]|nr:diphthine synthase [Thermoplasmata archaeon]
MAELIFIGLGLWDEKDITLRGLEVARKCDRLYAEFYTSKLTGLKAERLEKLLGKSITVLSRFQVEERADEILEQAEKTRVAFLVPGDPMTATTHLSLRIQAAEKGIETRVINGVSIRTAVASLLGLQSYKFGRTTTLVFPEPSFFPLSPYEAIKENKRRGLHTLVLLDIKAEAERYMCANEGIELLLKMESIKKENVLADDTLIAVVAQAGSPRPEIKVGGAKVLAREKFGKPLHSLVVPGKLHFMEQKALEFYRVESNARSTL